MSTPFDASQIGASSDAGLELAQSGVRQMCATTETGQI